MKKPLETLIRGSRSRKRGVAVRELASGDALVLGHPAATGSPCSSVPVRKNTSSPRWRRWRARMSAPIVVYARPRCGAAFT